MIVGCYTMDLYCDVEGCTYNNRGGLCEPDQFTGLTVSECRRKARAEGWRLDIRTGMATPQIAVCPECGHSARLLRDKMEEKGL